MTINYLERKLSKLIEENKKLFTESYSKGVIYQINENYDSYKWKVNLKIGHMSFYFSNLLAPKQPPRNRPLENKYLLGEYYCDIYKAYIINTLLDPHTTKGKIRAVVNIRPFIGFIEQKNILLSAVCSDSLFSYYDYVKHNYNGKSIIHHAQEACKFLEWCNDNKYLQSKFKIYHPFSKERKASESTANALANRKKKLPEDDIVKACGSIFNVVMPAIGDDTDLTTKVRDRFTAGLLSIAFASPNRMQAEAFLIVIEKLKKKTVNIGDNAKNIYWINWQGSKGYKDNRNHILSQMAPYVDRSMRWFSDVCEPARALCRFYENPNAPLSSILGKLKYLDTHNLSLDNPVNIYQLGGILELYNGDNICHKKIDGFPFNPDMSYIPTSNVLKSSLFGLLHRDSIRLPESFRKENLTLRDYEKYWIEYLLKNLKEFPYRYTTETNKVRLSTALIVFRGDQLGSAGSRFSFGGSPFSVESCDLGEVFQKDLARSNNGTSIFSRHGFSDIFRLTPHQPRHYLNTSAQELRLSDTVIAHWSGRESVNENAVYDHTTEDQKHARLSEIYQGDYTTSINPITAEEYEKQTGRCATQMATGICVQPLHQSPCTHLSDCEEHCIGCHQSCHIKGDNNALSLMKADLKSQQLRLKQAPLLIHTDTNVISKRWFDLHSKKVEMYINLIDLMEDEKIPNGSIIRYEGSSNRLLISDMRSNSIEYVPIKSLPSNIDTTKTIKPPEVDADVLDMINLLEKY
ncbi:hypothetical protein [Agarivorans sp. DSG3-1]|uniref:hypothetical protein n=1 Tax=Agarivorans sp. DSG3-1 TaxID=3342249 RepID=UPI00398F84FD